MKGLQIKSLSQAYDGNFILNNINTVIEPRKIYGLLGRNGAGKSTLLNILVEREKLQEGTITLDDEPLKDSDHQMKNIYLMSEDNLYPKSAKVFEIIKWSDGFYENFNMHLAKKLLHKFEVNEKTRFIKLSTGYKTIVKLIVALCVPCEYIFLDEPILGLDANHRKIFYDTLIETYSKNPRTFVISTHIIEEVATLIEHVIVVSEGKIIVDDDTDDVLQKAFMVSGPANEVDEFCQGLNIIGSDRLARIKANYVFGSLGNKEIPDVISIDNLDLQTLFVNLTKGVETLG